ncbi:hypothetical protein EG329_009097 [Mollisiaceae sp. DMI_Dod_QoI]|nr:hypothetical protein EG329_009097 [Helotiales sp. DMI_Dod_QoI]
MSEQSQSSEEAEELSALEYARTSGLSRNHLTEELGVTELLQLQSQLVDNLLDCSNLRQFNLGPERKVEERLTCSKDVALLLSSVKREEVPQDIDSLVLPMLDTRQHGWPTKVELPLLRSDHEADCKSFASREGFNIKLQDVKLPLEIVNDEKNEGLVWPARFWNMGSEILQRLKMEKQSVPKERMMFISTCLKNDWSNDDAKALWDREQKYKRNTALDPVTPPLSPAFKPLQQPYEPSSSDSAYQLPILSDPESPTKQELKAIEKIIFEKDIPTPLRRAKTIRPSEQPSSDTMVDDSILKLCDIYTPLASLENTPPSIEVKRVKREVLIVEEILLPERSGIEAPKSVRFSEIIEELELDSDSRVVSPAYEHNLLEEAFGDALRVANQRAEQEKLIAADTTARVDVPIMDFSKSDPPWKKFEAIQNKVALASLRLKFIREAVGERPLKCVLINHKDLNLKWTPFPTSLAKVAVEEHFEDDQKLHAFLKDLECGEIIDSSSLTWKPVGMMILKDNEDDDEIEQGIFQHDTPRDLSFLVRKRKMELQVDAAREPALKKLTPAAQQMPPARYSPTGVQKLPGSIQEQLSYGDSLEKPGLLLGGAFSAENCLDNYLELRGSKKAKLTNSNYFSTKSDSTQSVPATQALRSNPPQLGTIQLPIRKSPVAKASPLPAPPLSAASPMASIVVSSTLLKQRTLIKHIERILPALIIVERDFTAHNTTTWLPGSVTRSPVRSPLDSEADIIASPSTGIVITTLQKIKQKPLPGQKAKPAIRDHLEKISGRYEKLIVLVSEGRGDESTIGLDESDCLAYSEFVGFAAGFETSITVILVAGGEETLSKWLASTIVRYCVGGETTLLAEETHWELFLRRAGLNAYAAQAILAELKALDGVDPGSPTKAGQFGLTAFVEMGREQRIARFGPVCGKILMERLSDGIDSRWE